jgi:hypothetical protein
MAKKGILKALVAVALFLWVLPLVSFPVFAQGTTTPPASGTTPPDSKNVPDAADATGCESTKIPATGMFATPPNCLYLEEPLDDKNLYYVSCDADAAKTGCATIHYTGGVIDPKTQRGPIQAILTRQKSKPEQGSFGLLYNYLHLVYNYLSGIVIGISVLFVVYGGFQIATAGGETGGVDSGRKRITQAVSGLILWFTASLILYTINPTFFSL